MRNYPKVAADMVWSQMMWTFGFLGIMFVINLIQIVFKAIQGTEVDGGFYANIMIAANIYMLIIGIIAIYFLPYYVEMGVTRKEYFKGTFLASIGISIAIPAVTLLVSILERFILINVLNLNYKVQDINNIVNEVVLDIDDSVGGVIAELVLSFILSPNVDPSTNWLLAIAVFALNIFIFYLLGWLISAGFYAGGTITGLLFIVIAIVINILKDTLLRISLDLPVSARFSTLDDLSLWITIPGILLLILLVIWVIRLLTKKATVKM